MKRIEQLDGLRAIAFLLVFLNHSVYVPMTWVGVDLFFVLSGFLITNILIESRELKFSGYLERFYSRRARRILPAYMLVLAIVVVFIRPEDWSRIWWQFFTFTQNIAISVQARVGVLAAYWSLALEEQFYIVWPIICYFCNRRQLAWICVGAIVVAPMLRAAAHGIAPYYTVVFAQMPFRMDTLAAGALLALLWRTRKPAMRRHLPLIRAVLFLSALCFFVPAAFARGWRASADSLAFNVFGYSISVVMFFALIALALVSESKWVQRPLRAAPLRAIGKTSYMSYLAHEPILHFTLPAFGRFGGSLIGFVVTMAVAAASWKWIESPILNTSRPNSLAE